MLANHSKCWAQLENNRGHVSKFEACFAEVENWETDVSQLFFFVDNNFIETSPMGCFYKVSLYQRVQWHKRQGKSQQLHIQAKRLVSDLCLITCPLDTETRDSWWCYVSLMRDSCLGRLDSSPTGTFYSDLLSSSSRYQRIHWNLAVTCQSLLAPLLLQLLLVNIDAYLSQIINSKIARIDPQEIFRWTILNIRSSRLC